MENCQHYSRGCLLLSPCCEEWFSCRLCHDQVHYEEEKDVKKQHKMDRFAVQKVKCKSCGHVQEPLQSCDNCSKVLGYYFCGVCKLYDDNRQKKIFHCEGCGICRLGKREHFFHCYQCNACLPKSMENNHPCMEDVLNSNCPFCLENMFESRQTSQPMKCGHFIHSKCFKQLLKNNFIRCPICQKSLFDTSEHNEEMDKLIENTPMPEEYRNVNVEILCNDCNQKSEVLFHFYGLKCKHCGSYNTVRT